ncbi:MAG: hypothetical protein ACRCSQ_00330 [Bacteroidales bacterium]
MRTQLLIVFCIFAAFGSFTQLKADNLVLKVPTQNLNEPETTAECNFGWASAIGDGDIFVSNYTANSPNDPLKSRVGRIYVYKKNNQGEWLVDQTIHSSLDEKGAAFGLCMATDGKRLVVGMTQSFADAGKKNGCVSVYVKNDLGKWIPEQLNITPANPYTDALWGSAVAIDGNVMAVGTPKAGADSYGTASIFERDNDGVWKEVFQHTPSVKARYGREVSVYKNTVVVGSPDLGGHVYEKKNGSWELVDKLDFTTSSNAYALSFNEKTLLVNDLLNKCVLVYKKNEAGKWTDTGIKLSDADHTQTLGSIIRLKGNYAMITTNNKGFCYLFSEDASGNWTMTAKMTPPQGADIANFGYSADFNGKEAVITRFGHKEDGIKKGQAHYYDLSDITTPVKQIINSSVQIKQLSEGLEVSSDQPVAISVNTIDGKCVFAYQMIESQVLIPLKKGIYLIRIGNQTTKIVL